MNGGPDGLTRGYELMVQETLFQPPRPEPPRPPAGYLVVHAVEERLPDGNWFTVALIRKEEPAAPPSTVDAVTTPVYAADGSAAYTLTRITRR